MSLPCWVDVVVASVGLRDRRDGTSVAVLTLDAGSRCFIDETSSRNCDIRVMRRSKSSGTTGSSEALVVPEGNSSSASRVSRSG